MSGRPSELALTIAALPGRYATDGWVYADNVRHSLRLIGFDLTTQQVAASLARMARTDAPWVERRKAEWHNVWEYRVTHFGLNDLENRLSLAVSTPWLPGRS
jgi:hypothetical protein